jgi:hypothetical protein
MSAPLPVTRSLRLAPSEWLFLAATIAFWAGFAAFLGKDTSWDFRNYHWYIPYAFLNGRLSIDVAVAHQASYYNPFLDIPFYWLASNAPSWAALAALGAVQGANVVPLYLIARQCLRIEEYKLGAGALALLGQTGGLTLSLLGLHYYDNVMSVFILASVAILVVRHETLRAGPLGTAAALSFGAAFLTGATVGLKLPEAPFALGVGAAILFMGGDWKHIAARAGAGALGGIAGAALTGGYWMLEMQHLTGNPLFPYFNEHFRSALALDRDYRDLRFVPTRFWKQILYPVYFGYDWSVADDLPYRDIRVPLAYASVIAALLVWMAGRRSRDPLVAPGESRVLFAFAAVSYVAWLKVFAIYRYILTLEMLSPILIATAVGLMPVARRAQLLALGALYCAALLLTRPDFLERAPLGDPYVDVAVPDIPHPDRTMVLMTGNEPMGFIVPELPHRIAVLRIDGWMLHPGDASGLTRIMRARVRAFRGDLYLMADADDMTRAHDALAEYDLAIDWPKCNLFDTNILGAYQLCPLFPRPGKH